MKGTRLELNGTFVLVKYKDPNLKFELGTSCCHPKKVLDNLDHVRLPLVLVLVGHLVWMGRGDHYKTFLKHSFMV